MGGNWSSATFDELKSSSPNAIVMGPVGSRPGRTGKRLTSKLVPRMATTAERIIQKEADARAHRHTDAIWKATGIQEPPKDRGSFEALKKSQRN